VLKPVGKDSESTGEFTGDPTQKTKVAMVIAKVVEAMGTD